VENQMSITNISVESAINTGYNIATQWAIIITRNKMINYTEEHGPEKAEQVWYDFILNYFHNAGAHSLIN